MRTPPTDIVAAALAAQSATGILPSVQLAQWALESGWGAHCTGRFNFFGVKAVADQAGTMCWTHEEQNGRLVAVQALFRDYDTVADAFLEHAQLLAGPVYAHAEALKDDASGFVRAISLPNHPAYATDSEYADKLLELIGDEKFGQYDLQTASDLAASQALTQQALK
jgi:flagellum-specific peptidoglycan hydrolase FlgJ